MKRPGQLGMVGSMNKRGLITGITGQDGSYLSELLLDKGYEVHGIIRRVALEDPQQHLWRIRHLLDKIKLHEASMESFASLFRVVVDVEPDECYHLAAQSFVSYSFDDEFSTLNTNINGTHFILSALKDLAPKCRIYFSASSEMFGNTIESPQNENTPFFPRSPYGISKLAGYHLTRNYREAYGLFACNGILFNHESERRGYEFVTRKISIGAAKIKLGMEKELRLGNLEVNRDWGYSPDYVQAMWMMLQKSEPDDYVVATEEAHSVKDLVAHAFSVLDLNWEDYVVVDEEFYRPAEIFALRGDASKAKAELGWKPTVTFEQMIRIMVDHDYGRLLATRGAG